MVKNGATFSILARSAGADCLCLVAVTKLPHALQEHAYTTRTRGDSDWAHEVSSLATQVLCSVVCVKFWTGLTLVGVGFYAASLCHQLCDS